MDTVQRTDSILRGDRRGLRAVCAALATGVLIAAAACDGSDDRDCPWGETCLEGMVCDEAHQLCVYPTQLTACEGMMEGESCTFPGAISGLYRCLDGVCLPGPMCGDGVLDPGEVCDDGNGTSGDGCSGDCLSDETCGNGVVDDAVGEVCDCGTDPVDLPVNCAAPNGDPTGPCAIDCTFTQ